jgi:TP901 family phage tail tape measure protein
MADRFQLKALITGVDKLSPTLNGIRKNVSVFRKQMNSSGLGNIGFKDVLAGGAFAAPFVAGAKAAIEFESSMADVKKVVNFDTPEQFQQMSKDVLDMSEQLPMAASGIAAIVAAGGQANIPREELKGFASDAVKMGIAFDQTAEQSGAMMATWRTAFKLTQTDVVGLADKINLLGTQGAKTAEISTIVTAIGPLGAVAGLASGQIAALGATMLATGVKQDVAATGIKNFMLAMTKGSSATASQAKAFKSIGIDSRALSVAMQKDAQGAILDLLKRVGSVKKSAQAGLLTELFGSESVAAITPLLTNLDKLTNNLGMVGDQTKYTGSMEKEYASRSATTANAMQLLTNKVTRLGISVGGALLPPFNEFMDQIGPLISQMSSLASAHPGVIRGVLGAALAFGVLRLAVMGAMMATKLMSAVTLMSPIGIIVRGIALAAGLLIANWATVAPYFQALWEKIQGPAMVLWGWFKQAFAYTPIPMIMANWGPLTELFSALWGVLVAVSTPVMDFMARMFDWSPLGLIVKHWAPITAWFESLWAKLKPIIEPLMSYFGGGEGGEGILKTATTKANAFAEEQRVRNAGVGGGDGSLLAPGAAEGAQRYQRMMNNATGVPSTAQLLRPPALASEVVDGAQQAQRRLNSDPLLRPEPLPAGAAQGAPLAQGRMSTEPLLRRPNLAAQSDNLLRQTAANQTQKVDGEINVNINGAPPGTTVEQTKTNQSGLSIKPSVGTRTLGVMRPQ